MMTIRITKMVKAPMDRCFQLSRSIDLRRVSGSLNTEPVAGPTSGLIRSGDSVTWRRSSFLKSSDHTTVLDVFRQPSYYNEVMVEGPYKSYEHDHHFAPFNDGTRIREEIRLVLPYGWLGRIAARLYLRKRIVRQLEQQIAKLKQVAESDEWHVYLDGQPDFDVRPQAVATAAPKNNQSPASEQQIHRQAG
jgi:hypothetical protein